MKSMALVREYMDNLFSGKNPEILGQYLAEDFHFEGPFFQCGSATDYVRALQADPPRDWSYHLLHAFEKGPIVCLIYRFSKPGLSVPMVQVFETRRGRICRSQLIFDTGAFTSPQPGEK